VGSRCRCPGRVRGERARRFRSPWRGGMARAACLACVACGVRASVGRVKGGTLALPRACRASVGGGVAAKTAHGGARAVLVVDASGVRDSPVVAMLGGWRCSGVLGSCRGGFAAPWSSSRGRGRRRRRGRPCSGVLGGPGSVVAPAPPCFSLLLAAFGAWLLSRGVVAEWMGVLGLRELAFIAIPGHGCGRRRGMASRHV
jgi:hypothetical protein